MRSLVAAGGIFLALCQSEPTDDSLCPYKALGAYLITVITQHLCKVQIRPKEGSDFRRLFSAWTFFFTSMMSSWCICTPFPALLKEINVFGQKLRYATLKAPKHTLSKVHHTNAPGHVMLKLCFGDDSVPTDHRHKAQPEMVGRQRFYLKIKSSTEKWPESM